MGRKHSRTSESGHEVDFDAAYDRTDWSKYKAMPAFDANNRGNACRIFLEMEKSQFKTGEPGK